MIQSFFDTTVTLPPLKVIWCPLIPFSALAILTSPLLITIVESQSSGLSAEYNVNVPLLIKISFSASIELSEEFMTNVPPEIVISLALIPLVD